MKKPIRFLLLLTVIPSIGAVLGAQTPTDHKQRYGGSLTLAWPIPAPSYSRWTTPPGQ